MRHRVARIRDVFTCSDMSYLEYVQYLYVQYLREKNLIFILLSQQLSAELSSVEPAGSAVEGFMIVFIFLCQLNLDWGSV